MSPDRYYKRATDETANPAGWVILTIFGSLIGAVLAALLLHAINLTGAQGTAYAGLTHKTVRAAIHDALTKDLTADRIQAVLLEAPDKAPAATTPPTPPKKGDPPPPKNPAQ